MTRILNFVGASLLVLSGFVVSEVSEPISNSENARIVARDDLVPGEVPVVNGIKYKPDVETGTLEAVELDGRSLIASWLGIRQTGTCDPGYSACTSEWHHFSTCPK
jgi:hypothetical protein